MPMNDVVVDDARTETDLDGLHDAGGNEKMSEVAMTSDEAVTAVLPNDAAVGAAVDDGASMAHAEVSPVAMREESGIIDGPAPSVAIVPPRDFDEDDEEFPVRPTGIKAVTRWFNFDGRISVRTFRQRMALLGISYVLFIVVVLISELLFYSGGVGLVLVQVGKYVLFVLGAIVAVKRCHDLGQPGAMVLLPPIWFLLWGAQGNDEPNAYGEREW